MSPGPPDHANGRGPPDHVRERWESVERDNDGRLSVSDPIAELEDQVDWDNLTPIEELLLARIEQLEEQNG